VNRLQKGEVVSLKGLQEKEYCEVLCYPRCEQEDLGKRLEELERLEVRAVEFSGDVRAFNVPVLGKGTVGIVVIVHTGTGRAALKIRRVDADRKGMLHEAEMLRRANAVNVGPRLLDVSENFLLMEFVEGNPFPRWIKSTLDPQFCMVLRDVLEQCYRLDKSGLDHGELSNAAKHIIVNADNQPVLVDFETASVNRKVSNVTSICQYFFLRSPVAEKVREKLEKIKEKELIATLQEYKQERTREDFEKILEKSLFST
jgi:putative serine/threonine protein kinase